MIIESERESDLEANQTLARELAVNLGYLIQSERAGNGLDQTELALLVGTSRATISRIERGLNVASQTLFVVMAELNLLQMLAEDMVLRFDESQGYQRKITGPRNFKRQQKWEAFNAYWNPG